MVSDQQLLHDDEQLCEPFLDDGAFGVAIAGATRGAATSCTGCDGTEESAGAVERNSSSAPGRFALRVIVRLLWR